LIEWIKVFPTRMIYIPLRIEKKITMSGRLIIVIKLVITKSSIVSILEAKLKLQNS